MGTAHARALASSQTVEIACVVEPLDEAAAGIDAPRATLDALPDLDGALVCVPTRFHLEVVSEIAALGLPVLCEKPCGLTSNETRAIAALGPRLQVAYWRRFVPDLGELRERVHAGGLGEIVFVTSAQLDEFPPSRGFRDPNASGGIVVDMGVHEFDQLRWLTGREIDSLTGVAGAVEWDASVDGDPELVQLALAMDGGIAAAVTVGRRYPPGETCRIEVVGLQGAASLDFVRPPDGDATVAAALRAQAADFALARGEGATVADAVAALEAAERAKAVLGLP
jgi:myo-inositol 2-dehydrogenase/D-chiro-inositol 1-dehydrogenase